MGGGETPNHFRPVHSQMLQDTTQPCLATGLYGVRHRQIRHNTSLWQTQQENRKASLPRNLIYRCSNRLNSGNTSRYLPKRFLLVMQSPCVLMWSQGATSLHYFETDESNPHPHTLRHHRLTALGRSWFPQSNVNSDLYPISTTQFLCSFLYSFKTFLISVGHVLFDLQGLSTTHAYSQVIQCHPFAQQGPPTSVYWIVSR